MRTAELRDKMVERVREAVAKWPTFSDMPEEPGGHDISLEFRGDLDTPQGYISALHSMCAVATPTGRSGNGMVGRVDLDAQASAQRPNSDVQMSVVLPDEKKAGRKQ